MIYAQEERRRQILEWCAIGLLVIVVLGFVVGIAYLYAVNKGTIQNCMIGNKDTRIIPGGPIERECAKPQIMLIRWTHPTWNPKKRYGHYEPQRKHIKR